jgi:hypothetical protein
MEHLVEYMRAARHSSHEPHCDICGKHCRSFEALRDHLGVGGSSVPKAANCADAFSAHGCTICLRVLTSAAALGTHRAACRLSRNPSMSLHQDQPATQPQGGGGALALGCKMVGAGSDGSLNVCARVCVINEQEFVLFEAFVGPLIPVTHYRYKTTGIRPEHLRDGVSTVKSVRRRVEELLLNGEQPWKVRTSRGRARLLVGHGLDRDLGVLGMDYPAYLKRDTATYPPLTKTRKLSNSLKLLTSSTSDTTSRRGTSIPSRTASPPCASTAGCAGSSTPRAAATPMHRQRARTRRSRRGVSVSWSE